MTLSKILALMVTQKVRSYFLVFVQIVFLMSVYQIDTKAQKVNRVDPPFWYTHMKAPQLQLLLIGENLRNCDIDIKSGPGKIANWNSLDENQEYAILTLEFAERLSDEVATITFRLKGDKKSTFTYDLKPRNSHQPLGLDPTDFMYLITPDRFANGDPSNDVVESMEQNTIDRKDGYQRHGGDIQGITQHLDYIKALGVTSLWINPVYENNQDHESYHGYAITDFYNVDERLGGNEAFAELSKELHENDMKLIKDVIYNHMGSKNYLAKNPPTEDWFHQWPEEEWNQEKGYTRTSYRATTLLDPYAAERDKEIFRNGWFDHHMPDINQQNPEVQRYLIQQTIWWIETFGIDALRVDTYAYPDQEFMHQWALAVLEEYPSLFIFAETWVHGEVTQAFFVDELVQKLPEDLKDNFSVTDFQLYYSINNMLNEDFGWTNGAASVYYTLVEDRLYQHPENLVTFADNHDLARYFGVVGKDLRKFKAGLALMATTRGIPQMYYGTELLMDATNGHGAIREDVEGGWPGDARNEFTAAGRDSLQNEAFDYVARLFQWRKANPELTQAPLKHFVPEEGVYTYARMSEGKSVWVIINANKEAKTVRTKRYNELFSGYTKMKDISKKEPKTRAIPESLTLEPYQAMVLELE